MNGKSKKLQQEILCGEKLSVNIFYIRVREYKSRHNLSEVQNPREMLLSHADGEKLKNGSVFEHKKSTPSKMKECFVRSLGYTFLLTELVVDYSTIIDGYIHSICFRNKIPIIT